MSASRPVIVSDTLCPSVDILEPEMSECQLEGSDRKPKALEGQSEGSRGHLKGSQNQLLAPVGYEDL